jgi:hypothetical protein
MSSPELDPREARLLDRCPRCAYRLDGLPVEHTCPECGLDFDRRWVVLAGRTVPRAGRHTPRVARWTAIVIVAILIIPVLLQPIALFVEPSGTSLCAAAFGVLILYSLWQGGLFNVGVRRRFAAVGPNGLIIERPTGELENYPFETLGRARYDFARAAVLLHKLYEPSRIELPSRHYFPGGVFEAEAAARAFNAFPREAAPGP